MSTVFLFSFRFKMATILWVFSSVLAKRLNNFHKILNQLKLKSTYLIKRRRYAEGVFPLSFHNGGRLVGLYPIYGYTPLTIDVKLEIH